MAQDIKLNGKTYINVPYTTLPKSSGGSAKFVDSSDATAFAESILSGYTAYVNGEKITGTASGSPSVLTTKSITANGTYNASDDSADGYSAVTVNVVPTNFVKGSFTGTTADQAMAITVPYTGSGYPIALIVYPSEGSYNSTGTFYQTIHKSAVGLLMAVKNRPDLSPNYGTSGSIEDMSSIIALYKDSDSDSTVTSVSKATSSLFYTSAAASYASWTRSIRMHSATSMEVYISGTSSAYGFMAGVEYTYAIVYSS